MATPGASIADRITDLIGSDYATVPSLSYKDLINAAFNEVVDSVFEDLLLKYSTNPGRLEGATAWLVEDRKILKVTRVDANSSGVERECTYVDRVSFAAAQDSSSIYFATAYSPVYHIDSKNAGAASLSIIPVCNGLGQEGRIWYFSYATNSTDLSAVTSATLNTTNTAFTIGDAAYGSGTWLNLNGQIANTCTYNRALSIGDVLQNYNAQKDRFGL